MTLLAQFAALGGGVGDYIEDVFSTYLYTGDGGTQAITNGIDLAGKGGLVWCKSRVGTGYPQHNLYTTPSVVGWLDTTSSNTAAANVAAWAASDLTSYNGNGFTLSASPVNNASSTPYVSWTFREKTKFFDVVTYTGTGANRTIAHNLESVPGCIFVKRTDSTGDWQVYHRSLANTEYMVLNTTAAVATGATRWDSTTPTSTVFSLGTDATVNASGGTYVAYLFAHNAGGFGLTGLDNVISCGSYAGSNAVQDVSLGFEPQWLMIKNITTAGNDWLVADNMRAFNVRLSSDAFLRPNTSAGETTADWVSPLATGFQLTTSVQPVNETGSTYIYVAIRRGPMKVPTTGTSVFAPVARTGTDVNVTVTGSAGVSDAVLIKNRGSAVGDLFASRLTGTGYLETSSTAAEVAAGTTILQANPWDVMDGVKVGTTSTITNASSNTFVNYLFDRAPNFMDVVCYTGTGTTNNVPHNLGVVPELIIGKIRSTTGSWSASTSTSTGVLDTTAAWTAQPRTYTSTTYQPQDNNPGATYVSYLFATCPGVSKVGVYTGTATTQTINCGFTAGSRFVMIKRTDSTGDWYVWDSARGIVAGNDPYLLLNSTAAEVTSTDYIDTAATGFQISNTAPAAINASGGTYIFLAIA
jgi:hypothetical protein